jgi:hypothetical protein
MAIPLEKQISETFGNLSNATPEKLREIMMELFKVFTDLKDKINSEDPAVRDKALEVALSLKSTLQESTQGLLGQMGLKPEDMAALVENVGHLGTSEEMTKIKEEIEAFKGKTLPKKAPPRKKAAKTTWIVG